MSTLELKNVNKTYFGGYVACQDISFALSSGEILTIYGKTGAGKSTLLKMISTLESPSSGTITIDGKSVGDIGTHDLAMTFATAELPLMKMRSVRYNLSYPLKIRKLDKDKIDKRVRSIAEIFHLESVLDEAVRYLDKDTRALVLLARSFMRESDFYLFDNVLADFSLDTRARALATLSKILPRVRGGVLYATDRLDEAELLSGDNVIMMSNSNMIESGRLSDMYNEPSTLDTMRLLSDGSANELLAKVDSDDRGCYIDIYGRHYLSIDSVYLAKDVIVGFYSEDVTPMRSEESDIIVNRVYHGTRSDILVLVDNGENIIASSEPNIYCVGDRVDIAIDRLYLFDRVAERRIIGYRLKNSTK